MIYKLWFLMSVVSIMANVIASNALAATIFFADRGNDKIQRLEADGSNLQDLVVGVQNPRGIVLDLTAGKMYWTDSEADKIQRADLSGMNVEDLVTAADGLVGPRQLALSLSEGKIYWADIGTHLFMRANLNGTNVETLRLDASGPLNLLQAYGVAVDPITGLLYCSANSAATNPSLFRIDPNAPLPIVTILELLPSGAAIRSIALDPAGGKIYWTANGAIRRANLNGTNVEDLVTNLIAPEGITLDLFAKKVYWTDFDPDVPSTDNTGKIQRSDLDGDNVEDVLTGLSRPSAIAIADQPAPVDHFKCYDVRYNRRHRRSVEVTLADQFESEEATIGRAVIFCNPVDKNGEGILNEAVTLTCYDIKDERAGWSRRRRAELREVEIENQFGEETLGVGRARLLCVPSTSRF